jgi:hypothetical protein
MSSAIMASLPGAAVQVMTPASSMLIVPSSFQSSPSKPITW